MPNRADAEVSLLDLVDNLLDKGVMLTGEVVLAVADVDLVYVRLAALVCAADRVLPAPQSGGRKSGARRRAVRVRRHQ